MIKDSFLGRYPSHFHVNPLVKAYVISESFMWSAWNLIIPIFAVYITQEIAGGNVQSAAAGYSTYLISRVVFELLCGQYLRGSTDRGKIIVAIFGMLLLSACYLGYAIAEDIPTLFAFYFLSGAGLGIAMPAKNALFSIHLDRNKEATEWSISDACQFLSMGLATALGGFVAFEFGFQPLFVLASILTLIAILPFLLLLKYRNVPRG